MGLDMYAFRGDLNTHMLEEIAYWRKHNALHNWMEQVWQEMSYEEFMEGYPVPDSEEQVITREMFEEMKQESFNCIKVPLNRKRIEQLEEAINNNDLVPTGGFFFGSTEYDPNKVYGDTDRAFIKAAKQALDEGDVVIYDSWW